MQSHAIKYVRDHCEVREKSRKYAVLFCRPRDQIFDLSAYLFSGMIHLYNL